MASTDNQSINRCFSANESYITWELLHSALRRNGICLHVLGGNGLHRLGATLRSRHLNAITLHGLQARLDGEYHHLVGCQAQALGTGRRREQAQ